MNFAYAMVLVLGLIMPITAWADGSAALSRYTYLCYDLGYTTSHTEYCDFEYEKGSYTAEITLTVDEDLSEPGVASQYRVPAGSVQVRFPHKNQSMSEIFMATEKTTQWYEAIWVYIYPDVHACLTADCVKNKAEGYDADYDGVSETDLQDLARVEEKLKLQPPSPEMTKQIQIALGTQGLPVVTKVKSINLVSSNAHNDAATVVRAVVTVRNIKIKNVVPY